MANASNETVTGFAKNLKMLVAELGRDDKRLKDVLENAITWFAWCDDQRTNRNSTPTHYALLRAAVPEMTACVLKRKPSGDAAVEGMEAATEWLYAAAERAAVDAWRGVPEVDRVWPLLATPESPFYARSRAPTLAGVLGLPEVPTGGAGGAGGGGGGGGAEGAFFPAPPPSAADTAHMVNGKAHALTLEVGDAMEFYCNHLKGWVVAQVLGWPAAQGLGGSP